MSVRSFAVGVCASIAILGSQAAIGGAPAVERFSRQVVEIGSESLVIPVPEHMVLGGPQHGAFWEGLQALNPRATAIIAWVPREEEEQLRSGSLISLSTWCTMALEEPLMPAPSGRDLRALGQRMDADRHALAASVQEDVRRQGPDFAKSASEVVFLAPHIIEDTRLDVSARTMFDGRLVGSNTTFLAVDEHLLIYNCYGNDGDFERARQASSTLAALIRVANEASE